MRSLLLYRKVPYIMFHLDIPMIFLQPKICFDHHHVPGVVCHHHHHAGGQDDHAEKTGQYFLQNLFHPHYNNLLFCHHHPV